MIAWPRPIEQVRLLPGPDRQLSQDVQVLPAESDKAEAVIAAGATQALPTNVAAYLTGDGNVVLLNATLIYRISDPQAFALAENHVAAAIDRIFRTTAVHIATGRNLNDFLVVDNGIRTGTGQASRADQDSAQAITVLRGEVRTSLLDSLNARLAQLSATGTSLGIEVQRIDMTAWLPPDAKTAFDAVLTATQAADRGVAVARTQSERRRQEAEQERTRLLSAADATAKELVSNANVDTAGILAIEREETPQTRSTLLLRAYRTEVADIMGRVGAGNIGGSTKRSTFDTPRKIQMNASIEDVAAEVSPASHHKPAPLMDRAERFLLGLRLTLALAALCLLVVAAGVRFLLPEQRGISDLVAGVGAALVAIPVFSEAWGSLRHPSLHGITDRLVALALIAAWATGDLMTAAFLPIIMTIGHVLEERSMLGSHEAIKALGRLTEADSRRLNPDGSTEMVPSERLRIGDLIQLRAGERLPADGIVRRGTSSLDLASLTGESVPVEVHEGDEALAGGMNIDGLIEVELTRVGRADDIGTHHPADARSGKRQTAGNSAAGSLRGAIHGAGAARGRGSLARHRQRTGDAGRAGRLLSLRSRARGTRHRGGGDRRGRAPWHSHQGVGIPRTSGRRDGRGVR